jgi:hypothetical protein
MRDMRDTGAHTDMRVAHTDMRVAHTDMRVSDTDMRVSDTDMRVCDAVARVARIARGASAHMSCVCVSRTHIHVARIACGASAVSDIGYATGASGHAHRIERSRHTHRACASDTRTGEPADTRYILISDTRTVEPAVAGGRLEPLYQHRRDRVYQYTSVPLGSLMARASIVIEVAQDSGRATYLAALHSGSIIAGPT